MPRKEGLSWKPKYARKKRATRRSHKELQAPADVSLSPQEPSEPLDDPQSFKSIPLDILIPKLESHIKEGVSNGRRLKYKIQQDCKQASGAPHGINVSMWESNNSGEDTFLQC